MVSIFVSDPLWGSTQKSPIVWGNNGMSTYTDSVSVAGGYDTASITKGVPILVINEWVQDGLGRDVEISNPYLGIRWNGFVNEIIIGMGVASFTIGPLINLANRVYVNYSDFTTGETETTEVANDTDSQADHGIIVKVLSGGKVSGVTAGNIRDTYLTERAYPDASQTLGGQDLSLQLNCLGYRHMLSYPYNNKIGTEETYTAREKIIDVLEADPNSLFTVNESTMGTNTLSVFKREDKNRDAYTIIKELVAMGGDTSNERMIFGIYEDREPVYKATPTDVAYQVRMSSLGARLENTAGQSVEPWEIVPGKWLEFSDFLPGVDIPYATTLRKDPRRMFIESVSFTIAYDLQLTGGKTDQLPQMLAKLGLGGI